MVAEPSQAAPCRATGFSHSKPQGNALKFVRTLRVMNDCFQPDVVSVSGKEWNIHFRGTGGSSDVRDVSTANAMWGYQQEMQITNVPVNSVEVWVAPVNHLVGGQVGSGWKGLVLTATSVGDSVLSLSDLMRLANGLPLSGNNDFLQVLARLHSQEWELTNQFDASGNVTYPGPNTATE